MTDVSEVSALMKKCHIRMIGLGQQSQQVAALLQPNEAVLDVMQASYVKVNDKRIATEVSPWCF